nr:4Fe-4S binding protein [Desulfosarcina cetonica]
MAISKRTKGTAAAVQAAAAMPRGPRHSRGYSVKVREDLCRGCGRCLVVCPYQAIALRPNSVGGYHAEVDEAFARDAATASPSARRTRPTAHTGTMCTWRCRSRRC